jgi:hypothetical protein
VQRGIPAEREYRTRPSLCWKCAARYRARSNETSALGAVDATELAYLDGTTHPCRSQINQDRKGLGGLELALKDVSSTRTRHLTQELAATNLGLTGKVDRAGDTMTGLANASMGWYLRSEGVQLSRVGGKVGIGTDQPAAKLDVTLERVRIWFPPGEYSPAALQENVRDSSRISFSSVRRDLHCGGGELVSALIESVQQDIESHYSPQNPFSAPPAVMVSAHTRRS